MNKKGIHILILAVILCPVISGCSQNDADLEKRATDALFDIIQFQVGNRTSHSEYTSVSSKDEYNYKTVRDVDSVRDGGLYVHMLRYDSNGVLSSDMEQWSMPVDGKYYSLTNMLKDGEYIKSGNEITSDTFNGCFPDYASVSKSTSDILASRAKGFRKALKTIISPDKENEYEYNLSEEDDVIVINASYDKTTDGKICHYTVEARIKYNGKNNLSFTGKQTVTCPDDKEYFLNTESSVTITSAPDEFTHKMTAQEIIPYLASDK